MNEGRPLLVTNCGQLLTLQGPCRPRIGKEMSELGLIWNGAVLMSDGRVEAVGRANLVCRAPRARKALCLDAGGRVVLPGFVDSHTHALFVSSRIEEYEARIRGATYEQIARSGGGIRASAMGIRAASERALTEQLRGIIRLFLEYGTTTAEVKSGYGLEVAQELKMLRAIAAAPTGTFDVVATLLAHDFPDRYRRNRAAFLALWREGLIPQVARARLAEFFDVFCDRGYFSVGEAKQLLVAAARAGLKLKLHAEQLSHSGAAALAARHQAVSVDHLEHLTEADIRQLRGSGTIATLLPGSVLHLGSQSYPPARRLVEAGVPVALATNFNPGSSPTPNMQMMLSLACSQMRMSPAEAVTAATINGAHAVARGALVGSLEAGKQADLVIMDVSDYREIPYFFGMNHCAVVIKKGRVVFSKEQATCEFYDGPLGGVRSKF